MTALPRTLFVPKAAHRGRRLDVIDPGGATERQLMRTRRPTPALKSSVSRVLFLPPVTLGEAVFIRLGAPLPTSSSSPPESLERAARCPQFDLAPAGVYLADPVSRAAGGLLLHRFDLARSPKTPPVLSALVPLKQRMVAGGGRNDSRRIPGGLLSVALAFMSPRPGVTRQPALWCPDFPPASPRRAPPANTWSTSAGPP